MSGHGRRAALPPAGHARPEPLDAGGLVVRHVNVHGLVREYDFGRLPVAEGIQRSLAALFAPHCVDGRWSSHGTSTGVWRRVEAFVRFVSEHQPALPDLDALAPLVVRGWRERYLAHGDPDTVRRVCALLLEDPRLHGGVLAEELSRRLPAAVSATQSYAEEEFAQITAAARKEFRAAWQRIQDSGTHLERWRAGAFAEGTRPWVAGEALDFLARTGEIPCWTDRKGYRTIHKKYREALGGRSAEATWRRLFLSRTEAVALGVLLVAEHGWNLSVIDTARAPRASADPGEDGRPTYRIELLKRRRAPGRQWETRNMTDDGPTSKGRLITRALEATRFARALVDERSPGTDLLVVWRAAAHKAEARAGHGLDRHPPVGPFRFGLQSSDGAEWARRHGFPGSPFRRARRTVNALHRREPGQNSQDTHDRHYVLTDRRVQEQAIEVIAAGAQDAADRARAAVLAARLAPGPDTDDNQVAIADCSDFAHGLVPAPGGGCAAPFLLCLGCANARIHPGHHPRLAHLHDALENLRSALAPTVWARDWADAHGRLDDLRERLGPGLWAAARAAVGDTDRTIVHALLTGSLDP
ncbi:hypothetical protein [Kitasatospora sp. NPDC089509]|uniref:hypothetical protein n=1 Tax=Kitasatospora sp. NPDC089509 TaxID=3364079 RepID=UPI003806FC94